MEKNDIIELIGDGHLQEAIKALEQATKGSSLYKDIIILSSSYSEYAKNHRKELEDAKTLEVQRNKIADSIMTYLDEVSDEDLKKVQKSAIKTQQTLQTPLRNRESDAPSGVDKKWYLYAAGALLVLAIAYFAFAKNSNIDEPMDNQTQSSALTTQNGASHNASTAASWGVNTEDATIVHVVSNTGKEATFRYNDPIWVEETTDANFNYHEVKVANNCIFLHDDKRNVDIELNLNTKSVHYSDGNGKSFDIYQITGVE